VKHKYMYAIIAFQSFILFTAFQCDIGYIKTENQYEHAVVVHTLYGFVGDDLHDYHGDTLEKTDKYLPGLNYAERGYFKKYNIIAMRIETQEGMVLAEYTPEYIARLREIYGLKKNQPEHWILTEKGLFFPTKEIIRRYKNTEKIREYYRSDEAAQDLQAMLEAENDVK